MTRGLIPRDRNTWLPIALGASLQPVGPVRLGFFLCFTPKPRMTRLKARDTYFEIMGPEIGAGQSIGFSRPLANNM